MTRSPREGRPARERRALPERCTSVAIAAILPGKFLENGSDTHRIARNGNFISHSCVVVRVRRFVTAVNPGATIGATGVSKKAVTVGRRVHRGFNREALRAALAHAEAGGVPRSDLARLAGISAATIRSWDRGGAPDIERLSRLCAVLDIAITDVVQVPDDEALPSDLRIRKGLTQVQLAAAAGLSTTVVSGFERAESRWSPTKAAKLAAVLGASVEDLEQAWQRARSRPAGAPP